MNLDEYYQSALDEDGYIHDEAQLRVIERLNEIANLLTDTSNEKRSFGFFSKKEKDYVKGLYIWGGVGRGKTFLMDAFYKTLPVSNKHRLHFHRFMILVHEKLHELKNMPNALEQVARDYAEKYRVLCLDEMHITDEGDAVIMEGLLVNLIDLGVTIITTSNRPPDKLTHDPYVGRLFARAVEVLNNHFQVLNLDTDVDYRLRHMEKARVWHSSLDDMPGEMEKAFHEVSAVEMDKEDFIFINHRKIPVIRWADGVAWFEFDVICGPPRARIDYIEIARYFHTVLIQDIPVLDDQSNDYARRFTLLIDELYDHNVKIIASAAAGVPELYQGTRLAFEFQRTQSRLQEMQSHDYLAREHES